MKERIIKALQDNLKPENLEVINNSYLHRGHAGYNGTNETHFQVVVKSEMLEGLNKVAAHRKVNQLLKDEFENGLHALEIRVLN